MDKRKAEIGELKIRLKEAEKLTLNKVIKIIDKTKIIKEEICQCGHPKTTHLPHILDKNGGRCMICVNCSIYTWKEFEFVNLEELKVKIGEIK